MITRIGHLGVATLLVLAPACANGATLWRVQTDCNSRSSALQSELDSYNSQCGSFSSDDAAQVSYCNNWYDDLSARIRVFNQICG